MVKQNKRFGLLFNKNSFWIGAHYSPFNKRLCINILPFITIWFIKENGIVPIKYN